MYFELPKIIEMLIRSAFSVQYPIELSLVVYFREVAGTIQILFFACCVTNKSSVPVRCNKMLKIFLLKRWFLNIHWINGASQEMVILILSRAW